MSHELEYKAEQTMTTLDKNLGVDVSKRQLDYSLGKGNEEGREANPNQSANMAKPAAMREAGLYLKSIISCLKMEI